MNDENRPKTNSEMPSRRRFLMRAAAALPVVATIPSGAALARSSNLLSYRSGDAGNDFTTVDKQVICLHASSVDSSDATTVDLGTNKPVVTLISTARTYKFQNGPSPDFTAGAACSNLPNYYKYSGQSNVFIPAGYNVSASAFASFAATAVISKII
jgi:hypothetical protein